MDHSLTAVLAQNHPVAVLDLLVDLDVSTSYPTSMPSQVEVVLRLRLEQLGLRSTTNPVEKPVPLKAIAARSTKGLLISSRDY